ncbi:hypothetical protein DM815_02215 [Blattabacterium sp. (Cryptocercus kyebangensis)]|uniref:hypothetical protein n=1 Tax=Blattabacterium sp. (Cryptocercus kyebangensis) TaxID=298656 RepID=UPI000D7C59BE|nr:hypothetical protein [Blattabacterium sp. (Cryptocercus kyebangensis)]AWU43837.1 hypothetical protein DM815_02215 [Blattabacterium sp. (Cryptocercus kyebangensis)]
MNTSMRFLIPTIFLSLGFFFVSCNDDEITSSNDPVNTNTPQSHNIPNPTFVNTTPEENPVPPNFPFFPEEVPDFKIPADIKPEELSKRLKDIEVKIKQLEKESNLYQNEYSEMIISQKEISAEIKRKRSEMRSKPYGSEEQLKYKKEFEEYKQYGKEKLRILRNKILILNEINQSIKDSKNEKLALQKMQENLQKKNQITNN